MKISTCSGVIYLGEKIFVMLDTPDQLKNIAGHDANRTYDINLASMFTSIRNIHHSNFSLVKNPDLGKAHGS